MASWIPDGVSLPAEELENFQPPPPPPRASSKKRKRVSANPEEKKKRKRAPSEPRRRETTRELFVRIERDFREWIRAARNTPDYLLKVGRSYERHSAFLTKLKRSENRKSLTCKNVRDPKSGGWTMKAVAEVLVREKVDGRKKGADEARKKAKYVKERVSMRGITTCLPKVFWPNSAPDYGDVPARRNYRPPESDGAKVKKKCQEKGCTHGSRIHREVDRISKRMMEENGQGVDAYFRRLEAEGKSIDPCTERFFRKLHKSRRVPVLTEFYIHDPIIQICTPIDMICLQISESFEISVQFIELKTGYSGPFASVVSGDRRMANSMASRHDTPYQRAVLQLLVTAIISDQRCDFRPDRCYVAHISKYGGRKVTFYPLPIWCDIKANRDAVIDDILATLSKASIRIVQRMKEWESKVVIPSGSCA